MCFLRQKIRWEQLRASCLYILGYMLVPPVLHILYKVCVFRRKFLRGPLRIHNGN